MPTSSSGFIKATLGGVVSLMAAATGAISTVQSALSGTRLDLLNVDLSRAGYALNGAARVALSGTTVKTIDLTNLTTGAQSYAGDTAFAKWSQLILFNDGAASLTVGSGASNGATVPLSGTITVAPGDTHVLTVTTATTVDGTHKNLDITPTSGGSFVLCVGGQ